jgi:hypothetical protein
MKNVASIALAALLLGTSLGAPVDAPAAKSKPAKAAAKPSKAAPQAAAKKVMSEKELQAEIASLQHLSTETGELEATGKTAKKQKSSFDAAKLRSSVFGSKSFQQKVQKSCARSSDKACSSRASEALFCQLLKRSKPEAAEELCSAPALVQIAAKHTHLRKAPEDELAKEMTHDLEMNFNKIAPFGKEDTAKELQDHAAKTQDTLVDAVENAEVAEIKRAVFRALTRLRAATIKEFDTIARLETQAIDAYNDAHHYRAENPLAHLHEDEAPVETDKLKSFH